MSAREVVREMVVFRKVLDELEMEYFRSSLFGALGSGEAVRFDPVAYGHNVRIDIAWMNGVLQPLGGGACEVCGDPKAKTVTICTDPYDGGQPITEIRLCGHDAEGIRQRVATRPRVKKEHGAL